MRKSYLPREVIHAATWRKIVLTLAIPLVLIGLMNTVFFLKNPNRGYAIIAYKWELLNRLKPQIDWLVLGDSSGNQGFSCEEFQRVTGESCANLCTIGNMLAVNDLWMLETYLEHNGKPKNVLLIHAYDVWERDTIPENAFQQIPRLPDNPDPVAPYPQHPLHRYFPLYYGSNSIKLWLTHPGQILHPDYKFNKLGDQMVFRSDTTLVAKDVVHHNEYILEDSNFVISNANKYVFNVLGRLSEEYDFQVYVALSPIYGELLDESEAFRDFFIQVEKSLEEYCTRYGFQLINDPPMTFRKDELEAEVDHLIYNASLRYTGHLIREIRGAKANTSAGGGSNTAAGGGPTGSR